MTMTATIAPSRRILRRIQTVDQQILTAREKGQLERVKLLKAMRQAYVADLTDVLSPEEVTSFSRSSVEAWITSQK